MDERTLYPDIGPLPTGLFLPLLACFSLCFLTTCTRKPTDPNYPPTVTLSASPTDGTIDTLFVFDPTGSTDQEDTPDRLKCRWDFDGDRQWDTGWEPLQLRQHQYAVAGERLVTLQIIDTGGEHNQARTRICVAGPPNAEMRISPETGTVQTTFVFSTHRTTDSVYRSYELEYRWDFEGDSIWDTGWSHEEQVEHRYEEGGDYQVLLEVRNPAGLTGQASHQLHVHSSDNAPEAVLTVNPDSGTVLTIFEFNASGSSDPDDPPGDLGFRFDLDGNGEWETDWRANGIYTYRYPDKGEYTARVEVRDPWGLSDTTSVEMLIENLPPDAKLIVTPVGGPPSTPRNLNASLTKDPDDGEGNLFYRWDVEGDGIWDTDWSTSASLEHTYFDYGVYYPAVEVMDPEGATDTDSQSVHVTHEVSWKVSLGMKASGLPALSPDGTRIFINTDARILYCLGRSGSMVWNYIVTGWLVGSPAVGGDGTVFVGTDAGLLYAITPNGSKRWVKNLVSAVSTSPAIAVDGTIYIGTESKGLFALNPESGIVKWNYPNVRRINGSPVIGVDGTIFVAISTSGLYAVSQEGELIWAVEDLDLLDSAPVPSSDGTLYVCQKGGRLIAVGPSGNILWDYPVQTIGIPPTIGNDGTLYVPCGDEEGNWMSALDPAGVELWRIEGGFGSPSITTDETLLLPAWVELAPDFMGVMLREYNHTGGYLAEWYTGYKLFSAPIVASDGMVYICTFNGYLMAVQSQTEGLAAVQWPRERGDNQNTGRIR